MSQNQPAFDFAVIGSGIAGASFAARVAPRARVLLLEREPQHGYHTTGRSAALYSALYGNPVITALTRASRPFFDAPPKGFAAHPLLSPRSVLYPATAQSRDALDSICASPLARLISGAEARAQVPILREGTTVCAAYEEGACDVDVHALHQGFLRQARAAGGILQVGAELTGLERGSRWRLRTSAGDFEAAAVVNAAGAWADRVALMAGVPPLGVQPLRRTAMLLDPAPLTGIERWPAVIAADESWYFKPDAGLLLASPADETPSEPCDAQPEELDIAICADRIETATTLKVQRIVRAWAGLRSFAPDRSPVAGYDATAPGFFWLAGQGGYGVQTAPALSEVAAALALEEAIPAPITDEGFAADTLSPQRLRTAAAARAA